MNRQPTSITLPGVEDRTLIIGPTGSGKTQFGLWLLSEMPIDQMPWVIVDYKREPKMNVIPYAQFVDVGFIPKEAGVYIVRPLVSETQEMEDYLMEIWDHEVIGLYIDEGVMLAKSRALETILIQGRSKQVPVIMLTQRPVDISRYSFSESQVRVLFPNDDRREQKTVSEFMPVFRERNSGDDLIPEFHSYYYEVKKRRLDKVSPVPSLAQIMRAFESKLKPPEPKEVAQKMVTAERKIVAI